MTEKIQKDLKDESLIPVTPDNPDNPDNPISINPLKRIGVSRREFLKHAATLVGGILAGGKIYGDNQQIINKVIKKVNGGELLGEIIEVIDSRLIKKDTLLLAEEVPYDKNWLDGLFEEQRYFKIEGETYGRVAYLEITNTCKILHTEVVRGDIASSFGEQRGVFMTLPNPQHDVDNKYLMHATFNFEGVHLNASRNTKSPVRGGIVFCDGKLRVGIPGDFSSSESIIEPYNRYDESRPNSAQLEYFFVFDSHHYEEGMYSLSAITSPVGKDFRNAQEFSSALVTFYSEDGLSFRTFVMSSYRGLDRGQGTFDPPFVNDFTIPQLISLAGDYMNGQLSGYNRYIVAFADPGPNQYLAHSTPYTYDELINEGLVPFLSGTVPREELSTGIYHRTFGGNGSSSSVVIPVRATKPAYIVTGA